MPETGSGSDLRRTLKENPNDPHLLTAFYRKLLGLFVPELTWTQEQIESPIIDIDGHHHDGFMIYVPPGALTDGQALGNLANKLNVRLHSKNMTIATRSLTHVTATGWRKIAKTPTIRERGTLSELIELIRQGVLHGPTLADYIVAWAASDNLLPADWMKKGDRIIVPGTMDRKWAQVGGRQQEVEGILTVTLTTPIGKKGPAKYIKFSPDLASDPPYSFHTVQSVR